MKRALLILTLLLAGTYLSHADSKSALPNVWKLARKCDIAVVGVVQESGTNVVLKVTDYMKDTSSDKEAELQFTHPPRIGENSRRFEFCEGPRHIVFSPGETWVAFFMIANNGRPSFLNAGKYNLPMLEETVNDVLALDSISREEERCERLVSLGIGLNHYSCSSALRELNDYNKPEYIDLLAPLSLSDYAKQIYIRLLRDNTHDKATDILLQFLVTESGRLQTSAMTALANKKPGDKAIDRQILSFLTDPDPNVRSTAVFILGIRDCREAFPQIVKSLADASPEVRRMGLSTWPWYAYDFKENPDTLKLIRQLANDSDKHVQAAACRALISSRQSRYFYFLWYKSLTTRRSSIGLALLLEDSPALILLMILWPTVLLSAVFLLTTKHSLSKKQRWHRLGIAIGAGYCLGMLAGWGLGSLLSHPSFIQVIILTPAITIPLAIIGVWTCRQLRVRAFWDQSLS